MQEYPFDIFSRNGRKPLENPSILAGRPLTHTTRGLKEEARFFVPGDELKAALNTAVALGEPLLITGEAGTGKTQAAYYAAYKLNVEPLIHFQVKSDSTAGDLLYVFDTVRYFYEASLRSRQENAASLDREEFVEERHLGQAFREAEASGAPRVLLIDEIDKAPRDFPNDLLYELDQMQFTIREKKTDNVVKVDPKLRPIVIITSNSERRLPEPFLRRCLYHHITFNDTLVRQAVAARRDEFGNLSDSLIELAITRFLNLRERGELRKKPATGELLVWLRILGLNPKDTEKKLKKRLIDLPCIGALLKDHQDIAELGKADMV